jgi:hypothetical protein
MIMRHSAYFCSKMLCDDEASENKDFDLYNISRIHINNSRFPAHLCRTARSGCLMLNILSRLQTRTQKKFYLRVYIRRRLQF